MLPPSFYQNRKKNIEYPADAVRIGELQVWSNGMVMLLNKCVARLSPAQLSIFKVLYRNMGKAVPQRDIFEAINWGNSTGDIKKFQVLLFRLRKNIQAYPFVTIVFLPKKGYRMVYEDEMVTEPEEEIAPPCLLEGVTLTAGKLIKASGDVIRLTEMQYNIFRVLFERPGRLIPWPELSKALEENGIYVGRRVFDVNLARIRRFLHGTKLMIRTENGQGHILAVIKQEEDRNANARARTSKRPDMLFIYQRVEDKIRQLITDPKNDTIDFRKLQNECVQEINNALLNVRRRYAGYIGNSNRGVTRIINREIPDEFY